MTQEAVQSYGWLSTEEMIDGLGLAETTPGPLILVTQFVGFLPVRVRCRGLGGSDGRPCLAVIVTLLGDLRTCFLWVFTGAPYIDWLTSKPRLRNALASISAAVVGVILNLSVWFALHVLFGKVATLNVGPLKLSQPIWNTIDLLAITIVGVAFGLMVIPNSA